MVFLPTPRCRLCKHRSSDGQETLWWVTIKLDRTDDGQAKRLVQLEPGYIILCFWRCRDKAVLWHCIIMHLNRKSSLSLCSMDRTEEKNLHDIGHDHWQEPNRVCTGRTKTFLLSVGPSCWSYRIRYLEGSQFTSSMDHSALQRILNLAEVTSKLRSIASWTVRNGICPRSPHRYSIPSSRRNVSIGRYGDLQHSVRRRNFWPDEESRKNL